MATTIFKIGDAIKMTKLPGLSDRIGMGSVRIKQPAIDAKKTGRNDLCYCGSGKKYKRCHGA